MAPIRRLRFDDIAPGWDFHAALIRAAPRALGTSPHTHDFWEMIYILEGGGTHGINGETRPLRAGDLLWIRPQDAHVISAQAGQKLHFFNVAFSAPAWEDFRRTAHLGDLAAAWDAPPLPPSISLPAARREACADFFGRALHAFHARPTRLDLCRFWGETLPLLLPEAQDERIPTDGMPLWLARACLAMEEPGELAAGVPRLVEIAGVSPAHLSRVLKSCTGQTPTAWVNSRRLQRARTLLLTTSQEITQVALDCGFDNLSYFYRRFGQAYGRSPRVLRGEARHGIMPGQ